MRIDDSCGSYRLVRKLGSGAYGEVWLGEKDASGLVMHHALKVPRNGLIELDQVIKEGKVWRDASGHPNVLPVIDVFLHHSLPVIVSEFVEGGSLEDFLANSPSPVEASRCRELTMQILEGLRHLHERRIIHRDLKPANILMQAGSPRISDFGLSRHLDSTVSNQSAAGTPYYMAPEAWSGERTESTDLWSVTVILFQLLTGTLPFPHSDRSALQNAILRGDPVALPSSVPVDLAAVVNVGLQKNLRDRHASAVEMLQHIRGVPCDKLRTNTPDEVGGLLEKFRKLPKKFDNQSFTTKLTIDGPAYATDDDECHALGLTNGASLRFPLIKMKGIDYVHLPLFVDEDLCEVAIDFKKGQKINAKVRTAFGVYNEEMWDGEKSVEGLILVEILMR